MQLFVRFFNISCTIFKISDQVFKRPKINNGNMSNFVGLIFL